MTLPRRLLIANRGEIACRIARTARRLGVATVAVFSDADAGALHVAACDQAVRLGGATPAESYLKIDAILAAARRSGAEAVHPGYGFLSENAAFAEACAAAGLLFVGPSPEAIRTMGSKSAAKALMERVGVPLTPGYHGERQEPEFLQAQADRIGYPVLIKASAGGGGKGMRVVARREEFPGALAACQREAVASFGDAQVLVERFLLRPRHIEVQVFGDRHGQCIHLFERDCSVQRRHQKVLEEAPAPGLTPARRAALGQAAVAAARAVDYVGAGTVEFIAAPDGEFYFMEMNTRLQVEHPVTEMITGLDLVEWQLRVAAGGHLPLAQHELRQSGHAIEARIYAEDPDRGFLPSIGRISHLALPADSPELRFDAGVAAGGQVTPYYDAMIGKLIAWGPDRDAALARLRAGLGATQVAGVTTNLAFLQRLVTTAAFSNADLDTTLIEREQAALFPPPASPPRDAWLAAAAALLGREATRGARSPSTSPWDDRGGWRLGARARRRLTLRAGDLVAEIGVDYRPAGWVLQLEGRATPAAARQLDATTFEVDLDDARRPVTLVGDGPALRVYLDGAAHDLQHLDVFGATTATAPVESRVRAPIPGRIVGLLAEVGAQLTRGTPLLALEAMKMEHTIVAPGDGLLEAFLVVVGEQVIEGAELASLTPVTAPSVAGSPQGIAPTRR